MATTADGFLSLYESRRPEIDAVLQPVPAVERERFLTLTVRAIREHKHRDNTPCRCTNQSMVQCVIDCAAMNLIPSTADDDVYLIPYDNVLTARPSWKGLVKNAIRANIADHIVPDLVREGDKFKAGLKAMRRTIEHQYGTKRGDVKRIYAIASLSNGITDFEVLEQDDVQAIMGAARRTGRGKLSPAWNEFPGEMGKKSAIRRLLKRLVGTRRIEGPNAAHLAAVMEATLKADNEDFDFGKERVVAGETDLDKLADSIVADEPPPPPKAAEPPSPPPPPKPEPLITKEQKAQIASGMLSLGFDLEDIPRVVKELSGYDDLSHMRQSEMAGFISKVSQRAEENAKQGGALA